MKIPAKSISVWLAATEHFIECNCLVCPNLDQNMQCTKRSRCVVGSYGYAEWLNMVDILNETTET